MRKLRTPRWCADWLRVEGGAAHTFGPLDREGLKVIRSIARGLEARAKAWAYAKPTSGREEGK